MNFSRSESAGTQSDLKLREIILAGQNHELDGSVLCADVAITGAIRARSQTAFPFWIYKSKQVRMTETEIVSPCRSRPKAATKPKPWATPFTRRRKRSLI